MSNFNLRSQWLLCYALVALMTSPVVAAAQDVTGPNHISVMDALNCKLDWTHFVIFGTNVGGLGWKKLNDNLFMSEYELPSSITIAATYRT